MLAGGQKVVPVPVKFASEKMDDLYKTVQNAITTQTNAWSSFHNDKLPKYRKIYEGTPRDEVKMFPWKGASNIVVQVVGQHVDTLQARVMGSLYELSPLWPISVWGKWDEGEDADGQKQALEDWLFLAGIEPTMLDFYRVESMWCADTLKYGMGVIKSPYHEDLENKVVQLEGGQSTETPFTKYAGPRPEKLLLQDFMCTFTSPTLEAAPEKIHRIRLSKFQLQDRMYQGFYDKPAIEKILLSPDSGGPSAATLEEYQQKGLDVSTLNQGGEWILYEVWLKYYCNGKKYNIICTYHLASSTPVRCIFNFHPDNDEPFVLARMGYTDDGILGRGFSDLLKDYQEEISAGHNQRVDKRTLLNTNIFRVDTNSRYDSQWRFYPGCTFPGPKDSIEAIPVGMDTYPNSVNDEMLSLKLAEDRSGVGPSTSGMGGLGSGTVGKTTGSYSSMGTYSVLQDGNRRVSANVTDFRYAHVKAGKLFGRMYAYFGTNNKEMLLGERAPQLLQALESILKDRIGLSIRAASSSVNREVEKQNFLMLTSIMQRHYTAVAQMVQAAQNQQIGSIMQAYFIKTIRGADALMGKVLKAFELGDDSRILPEPELQKLEEMLANAGKQNPGAGGAGAGAAQNGGNAVGDSGAAQEPDSNLQGLASI